MSCARWLAQTLIITVAVIVACVLWARRQEPATGVIHVTVMRDGRPCPRTQVIATPAGLQPCPVWTGPKGTFIRNYPTGSIHFTVQGARAEAVIAPSSFTQIVIDIGEAGEQPVVACPNLISGREPASSRLR